MTVDGGWHTRIVRWLKVVLPLTALALLSTLFLVSNRIVGDAELPYSQVEIEDRLREPRMTQPSYAGVTSDGASLTLHADEARTGDEASGEASALRVRGRLESRSGSGAALKSDTVVIDRDKRLARLSGAVEATTTEGYRVQTESLTAALDISHLETTAPVVADGPLGRITADRMDLVEQPAGSAAYVLRFTGNVKLIYLPSSQEAGTER